MMVKKTGFIFKHETIRADSGSDSLFKGHEAAEVDDADQLNKTGNPWPILLVDDEPDVHSATSLALDEVKFEDRPLAFLNAFSQSDAKKLLQSNSDIALAIIDVVMETDNAGLQLVRWIREELKNREVQIVLRTGYPGKAPEKEVILQYDINDYKDKVELTSARLMTTVCASLRAYANLKSLTEHTARLHFQANYDPLTRLPNRFFALSRLDQIIKESRRRQKKAAVFFIDMDDFKKINDTLGHESGDLVLIETAKRLTRSVREVDTVARLGGDEFIVLINEMDHYSDLERVAASIVKDFQHAFKLEERTYTITASLGIACYPDHGLSAQELLKKADTAMYHTKGEGKNAYSYYDMQMSQMVNRQVLLAEHLRVAIERGEVSMLYQPIVQLGSGQCIGAEALMRWHHDELGDIPAKEFIPIAEKTPVLIRQLGIFAINNTLQAIRGWPISDKSNFRVSVNVSPQQLWDKGLLGEIKKALAATQVNSRYLKVEITEGVLMSQALSTRTALDNLIALGIGISMDDFGTGYSSLNYLRKYPFDTLKIDQCFITGLPDNHTDQALVSAIIGMASGLGLDVVAEGVETQAQVDWLQKKGCNMAQGFYFGRPMTEQQLRELLVSNPLINQL